MQKPTKIELERRSKWYWLRQEIVNQNYGESAEYNIDGNLQHALNAVRQVAKKYGFTVYAATMVGENAIVVYKDRK